jgi:formylglycine-generating enzyme required for sulfatase activity
MDGQAPDSEDTDGYLYDSYLDGALAGTAEDPGAFLARHPGASPDVRARIAAFHRLSRREERAARPAERREAEPGLPRERVGEFRLLKRIGAGGMGLVFEAEQESLGRTVAVKILRPDLGLSPEARERFRREAKAVARLRHPSIVSVLAAGEDGDVRWIALDLVAGRGLDEVIRDEADRGGVAPARAARWAARIARALEYAHARGIVHRDLKPSNIRVGPDEEPHLLDFGVAREEDGAATMTGPFVGSVPWAAPEQLAGRPVDGRADVYGLGATLYHCLTGKAPFDGGTVDRMIHRALHEDPVPPGRVRPGVPGDLDAVVLHALEKDPAHRYASAGALAEDLEAVLEFRPVRARPPGPVRRLRSWARVHPGLAATAVTTAAAAMALVGTVFAREAAERARVRREAADEVALARARVGSFRSRGAAAEALEKEAGDLREMLESKWMTPDHDATLAEKERAVESLRRDREAAFHEALDHLRRAERLHPSVEGVEEVRARLYLERMRDAESARDPVGAAFFRDLVTEHDPGGTVLRDAFGRGTVSFDCDAPGAEVHLFRLLEEAEVRPGGERRFVPVPRESAPVAPGAFALVVTRGAGSLRPGDLVLEVAGRAPREGAWVREAGQGLERADRVLSVDGEPVENAEEYEAALGPGTGGDGSPPRLVVVERGPGGAKAEVRIRGPGPRVADLRRVAEEGGLPARVLAGAGVRAEVLPAGLFLRSTAAPAPLGPWSRAGALPLRGQALERGSWLAIFRAPGREDQRVTFLVQAGAKSDVAATLAPEGSVPAEFRRVLRRDGSPFLVLDREVTCAEYLEFLNDPATLAALPRPGEPLRLVPRNRGHLRDGHWTRGEDGRFRIAEGWTPDWPILGVSHADAAAYAAWRTARERPLGGAGAYGLPDLDEWLCAGAGYYGTRYYVFGNEIRPKWIKSCFSRRRAGPEPGLRFARDESLFGVHDMAGSVAEWCDEWYDPERRYRRVAGGSWAWGKLEQFKVWGGQGWRPDSAGDETGFRLVLREAAK